MTSCRPTASWSRPTTWSADESAVTGESRGVDKRDGDSVLAGTTLSGGRGRAVVTATGAASTLGAIAALVASARPGPTPLQRRLTLLGRQLTVVAVAAAGVVMALSLARGLGWEDAALQGASLAVAAVPESLPAVLTLSLALGARRMARHSAIARELRAVETLGSVTLLATDKTGTLTENRMVVVAAWTPHDEYVVSGPGYAPAGSVDLDPAARSARACGCWPGTPCSAATPTWNAATTSGCPSATPPKRRWSPSQPAPG